MEKICYVSSYIDIGREYWTTCFKRTTDDYFNAFKPLLSLFEKLPVNLQPYFELIVYIDEMYYYRLKDVDIFNVRIIPVGKKFLTENIPAWNKINREMEVMMSDDFRRTYANRLFYPEASNFFYTTLQHAKSDFVAYSTQISNAEYFCWVDFGYFKEPSYIPNQLIDLNYFDKTKINYSLVENIDERDKDIFYTMRVAPDRIGGFFFLANRENVLLFQKLYHEMHDYFHGRNIVDDDQHIVLRVYFKYPELFKLHSLGGWHKILKEYQLKI